MDDETVQVFFDQGGAWGWQCFLCGAEVTGLSSMRVAELGRDDHECQQP